MKILREIGEILQNITGETFEMSKKYSDEKLDIDLLIKENKVLKERESVINNFLIITKTDLHGLITYVSDSFVKISKYSREELIGQPHNIVRHPDVPKKLFETLWHRLQVKNEGWKGVVKNLAKDGTTYFVESYITPIMDNQGNFVEYISIRKDITKRIEREKSLNSEKKFVQDLLNSQDSIILLTNERQGMLDVNKKFFEYVDFRSIQEFKLYFNCIGDLFIPEEQMVYNCSIDWIEDIFHNKNKVHKAKLIGKDNQVYYFSIRVDKIVASNSRIKKYNLLDNQLYLITLHDVTNLELALQKAKAGTEAKSRFLANMSHEIRTPMNGILGFTELMKKTDLTPDQEKYINTIGNSSKTLLGIINDILDFSKVESGNMSLEYIRFNPIHEFEPTLDLFKAKMEEKRIKYLLFVDPTLPKWIVLDSLRLKQVISNLIGNALKFTPENGTVKVDITFEPIDSDNIELQISIADTGIGIPKQQQQKIFTPFSQADESTTRKFGGTGLGLSISKSFIGLMGGNLELESEVGKGSKFFFNLKVEASHEVATDSNWLRGIKTLIYISNFNLINSEVHLLEKYLKAFQLNVHVSDSLTEKDLDSVKVVWIITTTCQEKDIEKVEQNIGDKQLIIVEGFEQKLFSKFKVQKAKKLSFPLGMSPIYDILIETLTTVRNFKKEIIQNSIKKILFEKAKVLIAEDNEVNQMFIEIILKDYEIVPIIVENGKDAIEKVETEDFDLILMDINMPVLGGVEATKIIRNRQDFKKDIPIIALTANAMIGDREKFLSEGMSDYLTKPIDINELEKVLKKYLTSKKDSKIRKSKVSELMIKVPENNFEPISKDLVSSELGLPIMFIDKLIAKFLETIDKGMTDLEEAIQQKDSEGIKNFAHKIKGSAGNLRFKYLADIMKDIEYSGKDEIVDGYEEIFRSAQIEVQNIRNFAKNS